MSSWKQLMRSDRREPPPVGAIKKDEVKIMQQTYWEECIKEHLKKDKERFLKKKKKKGNK